MLNKVFNFCKKKQLKRKPKKSITKQAKLNKVITRSKSRSKKDRSRSRSTKKKKKILNKSKKK